jgi:hypothetical protein
LEEEQNQYQGLTARTTNQKAREKIGNQAVKQRRDTEKIETEEEDEDDGQSNEGDDVKQGDEVQKQGKGQHDNLAGKIPPKVELSRATSESTSRTFSRPVVHRSRSISTLFKREKNRSKKEKSKKSLRAELPQKNTHEFYSETEKKMDYHHTRDLPISDKVFGADREAIIQADLEDEAMQKIFKKTSGMQSVIGWLENYPSHPYCWGTLCMIHGTDEVSYRLRSKVENYAVYSAVLLSASIPVVLVTIDTIDLKEEQPILTRGIVYSICLSIASHMTSILLGMAFTNALNDAGKFSFPSTYPYSL